MRTVRRPQLFLEALEPRNNPIILPSTPVNILYNGSLYITAGGFLTVTQQANGYWLVQDGGSTKGLFNVTGSIGIATPNSATTVIAQFAANKSLPGNLSITGGNSADILSVQGAAGASLGGNLSIDGGYGDDQIQVGSTAGLIVRGNTELTGDYGNNTLSVGSDATASQFRGSLKIHSMENITIGGEATVLGATTIDMLQAPNTTQTVFGPLNVTVDSGAVLQGPVTVNGISTATTLLFTNGASGSIGSANFNLGNGNNQLTLDTVVNGNVVYNSGASGSTSVTLGPNLHVTSTLTAAGSLTLNVGSGSDLYVFNNPFRVDGNFTLNATRNNNSDQNITFEGQVHGALSVTIGNSNDFFNFDGQGTATAGTAAFTFGSGNDFLLVALAANQTLPLTAVFGSGSDVLFLSGSGPTSRVMGSAVSGNPPQTYIAVNVDDSGFNHAGF